MFSALECPCSEGSMRIVTRRNHDCIVSGVSEYCFGRCSKALKGEFSCRRQRAGWSQRCNAFQSHPFELWKKVRLGKVSSSDYTKHRSSYWADSRRYHGGRFGDSVSFMLDHNSQALLLRVHNQIIRIGRFSYREPMRNQRSHIEHSTGKTVDHSFHVAFRCPPDKRTRIVLAF